MKKILVVLMILAVAGGVFAQQGEWSYSGSVEIGTRLNFDPRVDEPGLWSDIADKAPVGSDQVATVRGTTWNVWDVVRGRLEVKYTRDPFDVTFGFNSKKDFGAALAFSGDNFKAQASVNNLLGLLTNGGFGSNWEADPRGSWADAPSNGSGGNPVYFKVNDIVSRLWGSYAMFDGVLNLTVAYKGEDDSDGYWASDKTGTFWNRNTLGGQVAPHITQAASYQGSGVYGHGFWDDDNTFAGSDGHNYIRGNLVFTGFEFGLLIPNIFADGNNGGPKDFGVSDPAWSNGNATGIQLVDDALLKSVFGAKFKMDPLEFAAQFKLEDYGAYFGGKFNIGLVDIGLSFMGILNPELDVDKRIKIGGGFNYNADLFGAGITASLDNFGSSDDYGQVISINPSFFYKIIPSHFAFQINTGFYMLSTNDDDNAFYWAVEPSLYWNFKGTGAKTGYDWGGPGSGRTGIMARYRVVSDKTNFMDVVFNWQF